TKHIRKRIESLGYEVAEGPLIMSANSSCLDIAAGDYWLSVGDASAAFDPLSSQGIVTGLEMGAEAARAIHRRFQGDAAAVRGYTDKLGEVFARYLANLNFYYAQEWRWPGSVFWQRRAGPRKAIQFSIQSGDSRRARSK
ncbi:MAG TPA: hypothetical protein VFQ92_23860, partial [Blastocatellia bacterium]|nr:hypothetical protein [Blastocatellia bacterium]